MAKENKEEIAALRKKYYKHPAYGMVYGESLATPIGRLCWPSLVTPKDPPAPKEGEQPGTPRYETTVILEKDNPAAMKFVERLEAMTSEMLPLFNDGRKSKVSDCLVIGDGDEFDTEKYPYYKNKFVLVARNAKQPKVVDKAKALLDPAEILGGVKGKLSITPLITAHGISYKLEAVQLIEDDGTRFGGGTRDAVSLFDACEDENVLDDETEDTESEASETEETESTETEDTESENEPDGEDVPAPVAKRGRPAGVKKGREAAIDLL